MKKRIISAMLFITAIGFTGCNSDKASTAGSASSQEMSSANVEEQQVSVIWSLPDYGIELNTDLLNKALLEDGYSYRLKIQYISDTEEMDYQAQIRQLLSQGQTDIAFLGTSTVGEIDDNIESMVRDGILLELSDYLSTSEGTKLKESYYEELWDTVTVNGQLCLLPNQVAMDGSGFYAFNKELFTEEDIKAFDGTLQSLEEMLEEKNVEDYPVIWDVDIYQLAFLAGLEYRYGVLLDLETGEVDNIYESAGFLNVIDSIKAMMQEDYFGEELAYYNMGDSEEIEKYEERIEALQFSVWAGRGFSELREEIIEHAYIVQMPYALVSRVSGSTGISSNAPHADEALELLTLIYTNEKYSNLLIWGQENTDYTLENGIGKPLTDLAKGVFVKEFLLGVYDVVLPAEGDSFVTDRAAAKRAVYESDARLNSKLTGFQIDLSAFDDGMKELDSIASSALQGYIYGNYSLEEMKDALLEVGTDKVKEEVQRQINSWLN